MRASIHWPSLTRQIITTLNEPSTHHLRLRTAPAAWWRASRSLDTAQSLSPLSELLWAIVEFHQGSIFLCLTTVETFAYIDLVRSLSVSHDQNMPQEGCHSIFRPDSRRVQHSLLPSNPRWLDFLQGSPTSLCDARGIKSSRRVAVLLPALRARHRDPFHAGGLFVYQAASIFHQPSRIFYQEPRFLLPSALIFTKRSHFLLPRGPIFSPRALIFPAIK